jgi:PAS domain S-box-containing protein
MINSKVYEPSLKKSKDRDGTDQTKILLVDNLKDNLLALEWLLKRDDVEIFKANSGNDALELMVPHEFALALIDVNMPGMSGFELAELMRGTNQTKNIPIIFVTATAKDQSFSFKGYESGAVDFLLKPLDTHAVKSKVNIFIEFYRQKKEQAELLSKLKATQEELEQALQSRDDKVRQQTDELEIRSGKLRQGADREKLAEEQIHIQAKAMESTLDGIFIIDAKNPDFPIIYANPSFYRITGYVKSEILGVNYFLHYGPDTDPRVVEEIKHTILQGKSFQGEMLLFKKNGEKYWNLLRLAPVHDTQGTVTHYVGNKTDVTLMRARDLEIEEQREDLLHITRVGKLAEFVSSLAHEISQPLTAILSYAQAAQRMFKGKEPQLHEILQYIINDDQRAAEVIRRLRRLLKKTKPIFESVDINALVNDTVKLIMTHITSKNKAIKFELDNNLPLIHGDHIQLQQVLLNLISNSLEAMEASSDSRDLLIKTFRKDTDTIMVEVKDSGCGITAENMPKLFDHFFTSKEEGLGMGLSISRSIVEAHGGRLEAKNNSDRGATFYFTIPIGLKDS